MSWWALVCAPGLALILQTAAPPPVEFDIKGNESLTERRLLSEISFWLDDLREDPTDAAALDDAAYALQEYYRKVGYLDATVTTRARKRRAGSYRLTFLVREGPLYRVGEITFRGAAHHDESKLRRAFPWHKAGVLGTGTRVFTPGPLQNGLDGIRLLYRLHGFRDIQVESETQERPEPERQQVWVDVTVRVTEGLRYQIQDIELASTTVTPPNEIRNASRVGLGDPVSPRLSVEAQNRVLRFLQDRGFYFARVKGTTEPLQPPGVRLVLDIQEGPRCRVGNLVVRGNTRSQQGWILGHLDLDTEDVYRLEALDEARRSLLRSGLFRRVSFASAPQSDDETRIDITIEVEEKDAIRLSTEVGFGSYVLGRFGVEVLHRNLLGRGLEGRLGGRVSFRGEEATLSLRYPFLFRDRLALVGRGTYRRFEEVSFERQQTIGSVEIEYKLPFQVRWSTGYEVRDEQVHEPDRGVPPELREDSRSALLFVELVRDRRDSILDATRGSIGSIRAEYANEALGSELDFLRLSGRLTFHWPLASQWTLVTSARTAYILPLQSDEIPIGERLFLGGARSVRSFRQDELGPLGAGDDPIGGEALVLGNVELRYPIYKLLGGAAFVDAGSLVRDHNDIGKKGYRSAAGLGLILRTPIGPIRVDGALPLRRRSGEASWGVHFLLGHPF